MNVLNETGFKFYSNIISIRINIIREEFHFDFTWASNKKDFHQFTKLYQKLIKKELLYNQSSLKQSRTQK